MALIDGPVDATDIEFYVGIQFNGGRMHTLDDLADGRMSINCRQLSRGEIANALYSLRNKGIVCPTLDGAYELVGASYPR